MHTVSGHTGISKPTFPSEQSADSPFIFEELFADSEEMVLEFLSHRPIQTVGMAGLIRDNGIVSYHNRGSFYGCWNTRRELEGVALIGHATLFEAKTVAALRAFAELAKSRNDIHMIMAERQSTREFLFYYSEGGQMVRHSCEQILFRTTQAGPQQSVSRIRQAKAEDLELILPVHAQMCLVESGVNPLAVDPLGFRRRCVLRLKRNRTYVWVERDELNFKADIISETPDAIYLEGIWINTKISGSGFALRCLSQLVSTLLSRTQSVCLFTNVANRSAIRLYEKAGFSAQGLFESVFLEPRGSNIH